MILARARRHVDRECSRADHDLIASTNSGAGAARIFDHRRNKAQLLAGQALARNAVVPPCVELLRQQSMCSRDFRDVGAGFKTRRDDRSEEHTSELQSLMRLSYAVFCLKKKNNKE